MLEGRKGQPVPLARRFEEDFWAGVRRRRPRCLWLRVCRAALTRLKAISTRIGPESYSYHPRSSSGDAHQQDSREDSTSWTGRDPIGLPPGPCPDRAPLSTSGMAIRLAPTVRQPSLCAVCQCPRFLRRLDGVRSGRSSGCATAAGEIWASTRPSAQAVDKARREGNVEKKHGGRHAARPRCGSALLSHSPSPAADTGPWLPPACGARKHSVRRCCRLLRPWTWFSKNPSALGRRR